MYCYNCMKKLGDGEKFCRDCGSASAPNDMPHHLLPGTVLHGKFMVGNALGEGGFGITYVGLDLSLELKVAIKEFYPNGFANRNNKVTNKVTLNYTNQSDYFINGREQFLREAKSLAKFNHLRGIVNVREFFTENDTAYIIMDFIDGETLDKKLRRENRMDAEQAFRLMLPIMNSLATMHRAQIIHRDISPDNIMVTPDNELVLMDFGAARYYAGADKRTMSVVLKPGYAPYEQYSEESEQGPWTDVYGLCATLYRCITGVRPTDSASRIPDDGLKAPSAMGVPISPALERVLLYGLSVFPRDRCPDMVALMQQVDSALQSGQSPDYARTPAADPNRTFYAETPPTQNRTMPPQAAQAPVRAQMPAPAQMPAAPSPMPAQNKKPVGLIIAVIVAGVVILGLGAALLLSLLGGADDGAEGETTAAAAETVETTAAQSSGVVSTPNVTKKKLADAQGELEALGLKVETAYEASSEVAEGYVIRQSIEEGRKLNKGDTVLLTVSKAETEQESAQSSAEEQSSRRDDGSVTLYCCASDYATLRDRPSRTGLELTKVSSREAVTYLNKDGEFYHVRYNGQEGYVLMEFFSEDKNAPLNYGSGNSVLKENDTLYCCASDYATLRDRPSTSGKALATVGCRDQVCYYGASGNFYYVGYDGKKGYVLKEFFSTDPNAPLNYGG